MILLAGLFAPKPALGQMATGSYTGDGSDDRGITGVGFQPDVLFVKASSASSTVCRISSMAGDLSKPMLPHVDATTNRVQSLDADGFTVGTSSQVNGDGNTYYWTAFKAAAGELYVGSYVGDSQDNRSIAGVGFQPDYVIVLPEPGNTNRMPYQRFSSMVGDTSIEFGAAVGKSDRIQAFEADGFQLGKNQNVNKSGVTHHYAAFKAVAGKMKVGSYTGDGADNRSIAGVGFRPEYLIIKDYTTDHQAVHRPASLAGDSTLWFTQRFNDTNLIQALEADGFQLGNSVTPTSVNQSGDTYHWAAFGTSLATNYRSIGTDTGTVYSGGNATVATGSTTVTFAGGASLPANVGQGDTLTIAGDTYYILSKDSPTQVTIHSPSASPHTTTAYTITRAYNTLQAWENDRDGDLVADNRRETGVCYNDGAFNARVDINDSTTDATHYMHLTVAPGQRHLGVAGMGARVDALGGGGPGINLILLRDPYTRVEWLELTNFNSTGILISGTAPNCVLENLLIHDSVGSYSGIETGADAIIRNTILYDGYVGIKPIGISDVTIENVTIYNMSLYGTHMHATAKVTIRNVIAVGSGTTDFSTPGTLNYFGYNMWSTSTASGGPFDPNTQDGNHQQPPTDLGDLFASIEAGSEDLHLEWEGHDAVETGLDLSASFTTDIDDETRTVPWDIGADRIGTPNHRSIGTNSATVYSTGDSSITLGTKTVTFGGAASLPANVGPGDELVINGETFYIATKDSTTQVTVDTAAVSTHSNNSFTISRAYNTLQAWEDDRDGDLVTDNRREVGVAYNDGPFTANLSIQDSTTDATHYMTLTVAESQRHDGTAGTGVVLDMGGASANVPVQIWDPYTKFEWFEVTDSNKDGATVKAAATQVELSNLIVHDVIKWGIAAWDSGTTTIRNCVVYDAGEVGIIIYKGTTTVDNCTVDGTGSIAGIYFLNTGPTTVTIRNTIAVGSAVDFGAWTTGVTVSYFGYNMYATSDSNFDPEAYNDNNQAPPADLDDLFVSIAPGSEDYHLEWEGHSALNTGLDLSSSLLTDIDGDIRLVPWDIGADWVTPSNHRSIGTTTGSLYSAGTATMSAGSVIVTFASATLPANIGPGDKLVIGAETFHIFTKDSTTQVSVHLPAATTHTAEAYTVSRAYNTLQAWETARQGDLVTDDRREYGVCYNDGPFTSRLVISGSTTDQDHFMRVTVADGQRHNGLINTGAAIDAAGGFGGSNAIDVEDQYTRIDGLEIKNINDAGNGIYFDDSPAADNGMVSNVFVHSFWQFGNAGVDVGAQNVTVRNSFFDGTSDVGIRLLAGSTATIENCTLYGDGAAGSGVTDGAGATATIRNTISVNHPGGNDFVLNASIAFFGNNMFSTVTGFDPDLQDGGHQWPPQNLKHLFIDRSTYDLHLRTKGNYAANAGLDLSAFFKDDIDGDVRVVAWDIGADEGVSGTELLKPKVLRWKEQGPTIVASP
ncbi:MAG: right-handed parallel beta-helix repeat-containing protein [Planctomycetes bacterium]|nr:right-handed parallel beta-helix repeat-containing protein [Planctomycetota bacterium]